MSRAFSFDAWLRLVEERKLLLTAAEFKQLTVGQTVAVIPVDYIGFLFAEQASEYKICANLAYVPETFLRRFEGAIVPLGAHREEKGFVMSSGRAKPVTAHYHSAKLKLVPEDSLDKIELCCSAEDPFLSVGSGDGYTRFMLASLQNLRALPPLYFTKEP